MILSPTMKLRWVERQIANGSETTCFGIKPSEEHEMYNGYFVLQQYWKDDEGNGEWRDIEIEWNP